MLEVTQGNYYKRSSETGPDTTTSLEQRSRDKSQPTGTCKTRTGCLVRTNLGARGELGTGTHMVDHRASRCTVNHKIVGKRLSQYSLCMPSLFFVYCPFGGLQMPTRLVLLKIPNNHLSRLY